MTNLRFLFADPRLGWFTAWTLLTLTLAAAPAQRPTQSLDGSWEFRFAPDDQGLSNAWFRAEVDYPLTLAVPGCWDQQGVGSPTGKLRHNAIGVGWYRRHFQVPSTWRDRRVWLHVGGVHRTAKFWLNGHYLGEHIGYPVAYRADITPWLHPEPGPQRLVIAVDSRHNWDKDPLVGTFDVIDFMDLNWGGIQEQVRLEATAGTWLDDLAVEPDPARRQARLQVTLGGDPEPARVSYRVTGPPGRRALASGEALVTNSVAQLNVALPGAPLWTPASPNLLTLEVNLARDGHTLDARQVRFGLRRLEVRQGDFYLNGERWFLRGYGDDFNFPRELIPPADVGFWRAYLRKRKTFGFNGVRHHSMMPTESYLQAADEVGMFVQPELPIAYYEHLRRAKPETHAVYQRVWREYIRQMRHHPSVLAWCMGNEMWEGIPFGPELYRAANDLDLSRPVIDSDGLWPGVDRPTLDYRPVQFDEHSLPWGETRRKYAAADPFCKPILVHEMGNFSCLPDPAEAARFTGTVKPTWLEEMHAAVTKQRLDALLPKMLEASWRFQASLIKLNTEAARSNSAIDGYHQWLFRDYWCQSTGIESILGTTRALNASGARRFNSETVVLWNHDRVNFAAGEVLPLEFNLSDFRPAAAPALDRLTVRLGKHHVELQPPANAASRGLVGPWTGAITAPNVRSPQKFTLRAQAGAVRNEWPVWVWPPAPTPAGGIRVAHQLTRRLVRDLESGASVLLLSDRLVLPQQTASFKTAWWKGDPAGEFVHGNLFTPHPALKGFPHDGYGDLQAYDLLNNARVVNLDEVPGNIQPIVWALDVPSQLRRMAYLWEARVGQGKLLVSGFHLDDELRRANPAAAWMFALLTRYASGTEFQPQAALPPAWLHQRVEQFALPDLGPCFDGFDRVVQSTAEKTVWQTHREMSAELYVVRQTDGAHSFSWRTAPLPADFSSPDAAFVWSGGMGFLSQPGGGTFDLSLNGAVLCRFPFVTASTEWPCESGGRLRYLVVRQTNEDSFGLFLLTLPAAKLTPGQPLELSLRASPLNSRRWISVVPYRDVARTLADE